MDKKSIKKNLKLYTSFYKQMFLIRRVEETILQLFSKGILMGTTHTYIGQESCAVGIINALDKEKDIIFSNHRGHGHYLAYCNDLDGLYALIKCTLWQKDHLHVPSPFLLQPPCQGACPAGIDIEGYIQAAVDGDYKKSLEIIKKKCCKDGIEQIKRGQENGQAQFWENLSFCHDPGGYRRRERFRNPIVAC